MHLVAIAGVFTQFLREFNIIRHGISGDHSRR